MGVTRMHVIDWQGEIRWVLKGVYLDSRKFFGNQNHSYKAVWTLELYTPVFNALSRNGQCEA